MNTQIEIIDTEFGYSVKVNGEIILECLGEDEVKELTVDEILKCYNHYYDR